MKASITILFFSTMLLSCSVNPEPLHYGQDGCYTCKMTLMDKKFGAEIVTKKGKIYKFDDMNCMINFYNSGAEPLENIAYRLVIDFANPEKFVDAQEAFYVKSENIKSPMASQVAAFSTKQQRDKYNKDLNGIVLTWGELVTQFK